MTNLTKKDIRGAIRVACFKGDKTIDQIALEYKVNRKTVMKWKNRESLDDKKRVRKRKVNSKQVEFIRKLAEGKQTGIDQASTRLIAEKIREEYSTTEKEFSISHQTIHRVLKDDLKLHARKVKTTFLLTEKNKQSRLSFARYLRDKGIKGENIFFTDESRFLLETALNPQTNQIRLSEEDRKRLREGDPEIYNKVHKPLPKFSQGFMVAGGISMYGPGQLIFCVGTMDSKSYIKTLKFYKDDILRMHPMLYFQQDNAACHTSKESREFFQKSENFSHVLENWPPNSPDLSPIETLWALLKEQISKAKFKSLFEMKTELIKLWNRIPISLCKKLVKSFDKKIAALGEKGDRIILPNSKKKTKTKSGKYKKALQNWDKKWDEDNEDEVERVVFNNKTLQQNKDRAIREYKRRLKEENQRWRIFSREEYREVVLKRVQKEDWFKYTDLINKKKKDEATHENVVNTLKERIKDTENMVLEAWYDSLNRAIKIKMLRLSSVTKKDFMNDGISTGETKADENVNEEDEEEEENEQNEEN